MKFLQFGRLLISVAIVAALLPSPISAAGEDYELNAILSQTGPGAFIGRDEASGLEIVAERINKSGGIAGRPLKVVIADDQSNPQIAVQIFNGLASRGVPLIFGSSLAGSCNAIAALDQSGPLVYCFSPGIHPKPGGYVFMSGVASADYMATTLRYFRQRGWKRVALITTTDASGQDGEQSFDQTLALPENHDLLAVAKEHYGTSDLSVIAQLTRVKAASPQAVFVWGTGTPLQTVLRSMADVGLDVPISVSSSNLISDEMKQLEPVLPKELYVAAPPFVVPDQLPAGPLQRTVRAFNDVFKQIGSRPGVGQAFAWDSATIIFDALKKIGVSAPASQLRSYIANLQGFIGVNGYYDFRANPQRGLSQKSTIVVRWDKAHHSWFGVSKLGGAPLTEPH